MRWNTRMMSVGLAFTCLLFVPALAKAQSAIAGVVRDTTGAILPGVTVEAASPALIEKVRTVVSDQAGQYRIVDLRPGDYSVTFSLPGFSTIKRDGVDLPANFTMTLNADLKVGTLEETVTVASQSPVVDVQNFAYYLDKLRNTQDGDGTLLDHTLVYYGAGMSDSNAHSPANLPLLLAGGGSVKLKGGQHVKLEKQPVANLHLMLMDKFGVPVMEEMGNSTGRLDVLSL